MSKGYGRYKWGVPDTDEQALEFKKSIDNRNPEDFRAVFIVDDTNARITDKSIGLLQVDSILAAVAAVYATQDALKLSATACLIVALLSCGLLLPNLVLLWARDPAVYRTPEDDFLFSVHAVRKRAKRFMVALWLSIAAFALTIFTAGCAVWPWR